MNERQLRFCEEYIVDLIGSKAAIRAGYSAKTAHAISCRLLNDVNIAANIDKLRSERSERVKLTADDVIRHVSEIIEADPRDLTEYRRGACRYCYGELFMYQRTANEEREAYRAFERDRRKAGAPQLFDTLGGTGYTPKRDPHPDCPECYGDGEGYEYIKDTRTLSKEAARLYAGVKRTKNGVEIMTRNQDGNIKLLGEHLGVFSKRVELTGKGGAPIATVNATLDLGSKDPIDAAQAYAKIMQGEA